jgi:CHAT domain-containing protein
VDGDQDAAARVAVAPPSRSQSAILKKFLEDARAQLQGLGWSVRVWSDEEAVEEAVLELKSPRILQFATHGYLSAPPDRLTVGWDNPLLRSRLLLAGANTWRSDQAVFYRIGSEVVSEAQAHAKGLSEEQLEEQRIELADGKLTAYEVTGMDLRGTELVNVTACDTGLGEVTPDGVAGLRQGFLLAGARSLTMSMWEVPPKETTQQIGAFYERWLGVKGTSRYKAFRASQQQALKHARDTYGGAGHPLFWAGVVYVGDPGDLPKRKR